MITLLLYVIIAVVILILSPLLLAAFGLYFLLVLGLVFGGGYLVLFVLDSLTLEGFIIIVVLGITFLVLSSASNRVETSKKSFSSSGVRNRNTVIKPKQNEEKYTSLKLELRQKLLELRPAFSENSKILKIQKLNLLEQQRKNYSEICIERAGQRLQKAEIQLKNFLDANLEKYLSAGVISLAYPSEKFSHSSLLENGIKIAVFLGNEEVRHMTIEIRVRPISPEKQHETINVSFQQYSRSDIKSVTKAKLLRLLKKDIIQYLKKVPKLAEKIKTV